MLLNGAREFDSLVRSDQQSAYLSPFALNGPTNDGEAAAVFISVCNKCLVNDRAREQ